jgi:hypothetical protein
MRSDEKEEHSRRKRNYKPQDNSNYLKNTAGYPNRSENGKICRTNKPPD